MEPQNVKLVVETTARLHNFCIDRLCSVDPNDYCVYDDFFWQRTAPRKTTQPRRCIATPPPFTDVVFADAATIASVFGYYDQMRAQRWLRAEVMKWQEGQGYAAPIPTLRAKIRLNGLQNAHVQHGWRLTMNAIGIVT
jgi:hypothetical protein